MARLFVSCICSGSIIVFHVVRCDIFIIGATMRRVFWMLDQVPSHPNNIPELLGEYSFHGIHTHVPFKQIFSICLLSTFNVYKVSVWMLCLLDERSCAENVTQVDVMAASRWNFAEQLNITAAAESLLHYLWIFQRNNHHNTWPVFT